MGKYYGSAGLELKIITNAESITIDSTFSTCTTMQRNNKFTDAHNCYDVTLNYVENKTKVRNLYNIQRGSNLTEFLGTVQYYFSLPATVAAYKAPNSALF